MVTLPLPLFCSDTVLTSGKSLCVVAKHLTRYLVPDMGQQEVHTKIVVVGSV